VSGRASYHAAMTARPVTDAIRHVRLAVLLSFVSIGCGPAAGTVAQTGTTTAGATSTPTTSPISPAPSPTVAPGWVATIVGDAPILDASAIDGVRHVLAGALLLDDKTVHGWVIGFGATVGDQAPYHVTWPVDDPTSLTIEPAVVDIGLELANPGPIPDSVGRQPDGSFVMYGWGTIAAQEQAPVLWRASASTPAGPWTADPGVVFLPAKAPAWDSARIDFPTVLSNAPGAYVMFYEGSAVADPDVSHIGIARSANGVTWAHEEVPVLSPGLCGNGDDVSISGPRALALEAGSSWRTSVAMETRRAGSTSARHSRTDHWRARRPRRSFPPARSRMPAGSTRSRHLRTSARPISPSKS
jgi:hypothetical protein